MSLRKTCTVSPESNLHKELLQGRCRASQEAVVAQAQDGLDGRTHPGQVGVAGVCEFGAGDPDGGERLVVLSDHADVGDRAFELLVVGQVTVTPASEAPQLVEYVAKVLADERGIVIGSPALEASEVVVDGVRWTHVFYESGLAINVLYTLAEGGKRAVGFKLSDGMEVPDELADKFKFARQKSKLAGTIRGTFFVIKGQY